MSTDHRALAEEYANIAREAVDAVELTKDNALQVATAEALLAIFHQLKGMGSDALTLKGAENLADAMERLSGKLPSQ